MTRRRFLTTIVGSYLLGGISTGYYLVRVATGKDVRHSGSGSSGARNVGRALGQWGFIATAFGDIAKGVAIPTLARKLGGNQDEVACSSIAAVAGHVWPAQLGFRGGRGLTVAFGAVLATEPRVGVRALGLAGLLLPVVRTFTPAGLTATALAPLIARSLRVSSPNRRAITTMATIVLVGHRHYIRQAIVYRTKRSPSGEKP